MKKVFLATISVFLFQSCGSKVRKHETEFPRESKLPVAVEEKKSAVEVSSDEEPLTKFSDLNNMVPPSDRNYKRMTRLKMEEESELYGSAGSLWKMEGQTSYLFAENKHRREGDPTAI